MSQSLTQIFSELQTLWTNPASFVIQEKKDNDTDNDYDFRQNIINLFSNIKSLDDNTVQQIQNMLTSIMKQPVMNINYSDLKQFLEKNVNNTKNVCSHFVDNTNICDSFNDETVIPVSVIFSAMQCKSCHHFKEEHNACTKYFVTKYVLFSDEACNTCGLDVYKHKCCMHYAGSDDTNYTTCTTCGLDLFTHQQKAKDIGLTHCGNFVNSKGFMDCANCIHSKTDHYLNPKLFTMNKDAYSKFTDLAFQFQTKFIGLRENIVENKDMFMKIINMNYTESHPMYKKFANL